MSLITEIVQASEENTLLGQIPQQSEQAIEKNQGAQWTLPLVATQYQPTQSTPAIQAALQAQNDGHFLDALILLDEAGKNGEADADVAGEISLLRASFLLQDDQPRQVLEILVPLQTNTHYAADAYALTSMVYLQRGQMQQALEAARHAQVGVLSHLALSYALQGVGRLEEARKELHEFNSRMPPSAITLAREAEIELTLNQTHVARTLVNYAREVDPSHPYVIAVSGMTYLIDGQVLQAKAAFETALKRDPKDAKALLGLGLVEVKLGHFQTAHEKFLAANDAAPDNALILTYLGRSQQNLGQTDAARASWHSAQLADPKDPTPWLYQAQEELQTNRSLDALDSVHEAQARMAYRSIYRGDRLLKEDEQVLQANLAEIQRQLGLEEIAFHTLSDSVGERNSTNLKNQAGILQGQRFGESARRSLQLQSLFNEKPGSLPTEMDIYGDGSGLTGAANPQHGAVSDLVSEQASYNNYDELFNQHVNLAVDAVAGSQNTSGGQARFGIGSETLGLGIAQLQFKTNGFSLYDSLDNHAFLGVVQWRPTQSTQAFILHQTFNSMWGATYYPAEPYAFSAMIGDNSQVTRLGFRQSLSDDSELRGMLSHQQTGQSVDYLAYPTFGSSGTHSEELQYRRSGSSYATQWGIQRIQGETINWDGTGNGLTDNSLSSQQFYVAWQQSLGTKWQLDAALGWGKINNTDNTGAGNNTYLERWLPQIGLVYTPEPQTHIRFAVWQGMGFQNLGDATLAPVSLAGILLTRPGDINLNGLLIHAYALEADRQLSQNWLVTGKTQQRRTDEPSVSGQPSQFLDHFQVDESMLALYWQPKGNLWTVSLAYDYEQLQNDPSFTVLDSVNEQTLRSQQLAMRWFASEQCMLNWALSHNQIVGTSQSSDVNYNPTLLPYQESFNQVDASLNWKFNHSLDLFTAGVRNASDTRFQYAEIDKFNPRFSTGRLFYAKLKLVW